jgi:hypothetical protein
LHITSGWRGSLECWNAEPAVLQIPVFIGAILVCMSCPVSHIALAWLLLQEDSTRAMQRAHRQLPTSGGAELTTTCRELDVAAADELQFTAVTGEAQNSWQQSSIHSKEVL